MTEKKMGHPKTKARLGKRVPLGMKTTSVLRAKLDHVASESGRSLAQEVEFRLEMSFKEEEFQDRLRCIINRPLGSDLPVSPILGPLDIEFFGTVDHCG